MTALTAKRCRLCQSLARRALPRSTSPTSSRSPRRPRRRHRTPHLHRAHAHQRPPPVQRSYYRRALPPACRRPLHSRHAQNNRRWRRYSPRRPTPIASHHRSRRAVNLPRAALQRKEQNRWPLRSRIHRRGPSACTHRQPHRNRIRPGSDPALATITRSLHGRATAETLSAHPLKDESTDASPQKATKKTPAKAASSTKKAAPPPAPKPTSPKTNPFQSASEPAQVNLRAGSTDAGGTIDTTAQFGQSYTYTATRVRTLTLAGHALEIRSAPSVASIEMRDTFPPAVPQGLTAVPVAAGIDLSWEPDTESDLAGYIVYRTTPSANASATTPPTRLNPQPLPSPAFHDACDLASASTYRYSVTAIDTTGNESVPSAAVEEAPDTPWLQNPLRRPPASNHSATPS